MTEFLRTPVFIVEDNQIYAMMLDYILSKDSALYRFENYKSGEDCLLHLNQHPKVIILDYTLPGMSGLETLREIKKFDPKIHVIILTGNQDRKLAEQLLAEGADDFVMKQGHGEKVLIERIDALLEKDELEEEKLQKVKKRRLVKQVAYPVLLLILLIILYAYYV